MSGLQEHDHPDLRRDDPTADLLRLGAALLTFAMALVLAVVR
jgi:hypothetical protein